jgi:ribosomal protein S21
LKEARTALSPRSTIYEREDGNLRGEQMPSVNLKGMSFEKGLRIFRKKCMRAEIKERCREKQYYEKPNAKRNAANNYRKRSRELDKLKAEQLATRKKLSMRHR